MSRGLVVWLARGWGHDGVRFPAGEFVIRDDWSGTTRPQSENGGDYLVR